VATVRLDVQSAVSRHSDVGMSATDGAFGPLYVDDGTDVPAADRESA